MSIGLDRWVKSVVEWIRLTMALLYAVILEVRSENLPFMAGSIAYHAFVSIVPLIVLSITTFSIVGGEYAIENAVAAHLDVFLDQQSQEAVSRAAQAAASDIGLSVFSFLVLIWGATRIFRSVDTAFASIYGTGTKSSLTGEFRDGFVVIFTISVGIAGIIIIDIVLGNLMTPGVRRTIEPVFTVLTLAVTFFPTYYVFPDVDVTVVEVLPGTLIAALGWTGLKALFSMYSSASLQTELYGFLGVAVLLLIWFYVGGLILLFGAVVNSVLAERKEDVSRPDWIIRHEEEAERSDRTRADLLEAAHRLPNDRDDKNWSIDIEVDGKEETIPAPDRVRADDEAIKAIPLLTAGERVVTLTLRWRLPEETDESTDGRERE